MRFTKMQGIGNDYLFILGDVPENVRPLAVRLSDRRTGAGADGLIFISPSETADFRMRIFNADGSEAEMCGNGIRCVGKYVYDKGLTDRTCLRIETLAGVRTLELHPENGTVKTVTVDMGRAETGQELTPFPGITGIPVSTGNPHFVIFTADADSAPLQELGPKIEHHPLFPGRTNVEFVTVCARNELRMRVWERGSGVTAACGTGACASAAAAVMKGACDPGAPVTVHLDGGDLKIRVFPDFRLEMTGPAETVYEGEIPD